jgi:aspartate kinase
MRTHPGVAGKTFSTLSAIGVEPQIVNTSPIKIACFLPREDVERAVEALHEAFELHTEKAKRSHE